MRALNILTALLLAVGIVASGPQPKDDGYRGIHHAIASCQRKQVEDWAARANVKRCPCNDYDADCK